MKEITIKTYSFDELSDAAKEKARSWWREGCCDDSFWSECTLEEAVREAALMGIDIDVDYSTNREGERVQSGHKIYWSGFCSQGDGLCFEGTWRASGVQLDKVADGWGEDPATTEIKRIAAEFDRIAKAYPLASFRVKHSGHYSHEYCTEFDFNFPDDNEGEDWPDDKREVWDKECEALKENARDFMKWIYRQLEKEYEYMMSDECVDESICANEYQFTEEGKRSVAI